MEQEVSKEIWDKVFADKSVREAVDTYIKASIAKKTADGAARIFYSQTQGADEEKAGAAKDDILQLSTAILNAPDKALEELSIIVSDKLQRVDIKIEPKSLSLNFLNEIEERNPDYAEKLRIGNSELALSALQQKKDDPSLASHLLREIAKEQARNAGLTPESPVVESNYIPGEYVGRVAEAVKRILGEETPALPR